ncbi:MAG: hypothetical protein ACD_50C00184G0006 [uncultured bacterium]|nr:MAG: hypothetical protein ACD_50C00184G0006 [uncultured bacterium]
MSKTKEGIKSELQEAVNDAVKDYISKLTVLFDPGVREKKAAGLITAYGAWERGLFDLDNLAAALERVLKM